MGQTEGVKGEKLKRKRKGMRVVSRWHTRRKVMRNKESKGNEYGRKRYNKRILVRCKKTYWKGGIGKGGKE